MSPCPACASPTADGFRYCPVCGTDLELPDSPTGTAPPLVPRTPRPDVRPRASDDRFVPGTVVAGRYRIVGLLGRGGMGEVYRADDLKLEQPVALKFLPRALEGDADRLDRLYAEVRTARQVSHPSVCRVWDIGEAEGQHFLSMEFVDGENLASLLRRIGRFPQDKAIHVSRQIAEGLAAAHAKGLLHRDLKPANVMLDGQGQVRLTDFGLAGLAESLSAGDVRSGTPSYMSPEQLVGREVSVRSDIYALGLVIYEIVTGRRAFEGKGFAELARRHRDERPVDPSVLVPGLDPALERTILACLEKEPRQRPPSALVVAAMLAGRDPLEAAIAAGETPSPELVAAAGEAEGLRPRVAWLCLAAAVAGVLALPAIQAPRHLLARVPVEKSPPALEDRARELLSRLGQPRPADYEVGIAYDRDYVRWTQERDSSKTRWDSLATGEPPVVGYWYRQSPLQLIAQDLAGRVAWNDPPIQNAGMAGARYDFRGRLLSFYVVPPQLERAKPGGEGAPGAASALDADWAMLFSEARLDKAAFRPVEPSWTPPFYVDARAAWEGHWPARPDLALRVEAASYRGRPVWFEIKGPWTRPEREEAQRLGPSRSVQAFYTLFMITLVSVGGVLAYRNISLGRGDRRGAFRLALALVTLATLGSMLRAHHVADASAEMFVFAKGTGLALLVACLVWVFYLALEPYVRRLRPWTLVSWTRLLGGGVSDPVVGRDVLVGIAFGTGIALASQALRSCSDRAPDLFGVDALLSTQVLLSYVVGRVVNATVGGLSLLLLFLILRLVTRRDWIAALLVVAFLVSGEVFESFQSRDSLWLILPLSVMLWSAFVVLLLRLGALAGITAVWTADMLLGPAVIYAPGSWTGSTVFVIVPLLLALAVLAFRSATSGRLNPRLHVAGEAPSRPS